MCAAHFWGLWPKEGAKGVFYLLDLRGGTERKEVLPKYQGICCFVLTLKLCLTLCDPMDCSTPGSSALHILPEFAQIHVH